MVWVVFGGSGFDIFVFSDFIDFYIKLVFVDDDVDVGWLFWLLILDSFVDLFIVKWLLVCIMIVCYVDVVVCEIVVDIVLYGEYGVVGLWVVGV